MFNVPRYTSSIYLSFAISSADHAKNAFRKSAYSLISRMITSPAVLLLLLSTVMHIVSVIVSEEGEYMLYCLCKANLLVCLINVEVIIIVILCGLQFMKLSCLRPVIQYS